ncbi:MAG: carbamoyltransferase HypF [Candidatus Bathyarchaeota archaeon]|nr:carbamoyltransferase HypF [Candidatus Bathyarchaeota archaeon]
MLRAGQTTLRAKLQLRVKLSITGIVQGVGFRPFIYRLAVQKGLSGYVRNRGDAGVEVLLEGDVKSVESFMLDLIQKKPPLAQIDHITRAELSGENQYANFTIYKSSEETEISGSVIPPDIAICDPCLRELRDPKDPRFEYFFITCTDCGPRFTIIERLPYDRENTTMSEFPLCGFCQKEYEDPANRRFHAQTVACPTCGPKAYLTTNGGEPVQAKDPIREAGRLLYEGNILAVKGYGGFHIASSTTEEKPLLRLRTTKHRREKPFAIMVRGLDAAESFAEIGLKEQQLLTSPQRPIVLLKKSSSYNLSPLVAPNLHNIGVMLPYTGLHYMLFDRVPDVAFVMTSANPPNQPIVKDNEEALKILGGTVDYFLFHNRKIAHRCDDSVMRVHGDRQVFLRRSRGYAPAPIRLKQKSQRCTVGLGGELNNTSCVLLDDKAFISQHIGDVENVETRSFMQQATAHLHRLTNCHAQMVACDLHPKFTTSLLAKEMAEADGLPLVQVQHHHAHAAALMVEHGLDEIVAVTCDGYGYGSDGEAWGGEILFCTSDSAQFLRLAHLEAQPLLGGDLASRYPIRLAAGMLQKAGVNVGRWLMQNSSHLPHGELEANLILNQLENGKGTVHTTSCGRVLDAVAAVLGVCFERTYEGESAMKLESTALSGKNALNLKPVLHSDTLETSALLRTIFGSIGKVPTEDLAYSAHAYLARGLAELAMQKAQEQGVKNIGFTGGAACNQILAALMRKYIEATGLRFFVHEAVPAGDGGVSFGQAVVAGFSDF